MVVFEDMAGDLRVMVEHRNSSFVFCHPSFQLSFSLTIVYKTAVGATNFGNITRNMAHSLMIILSEHFHLTDLVHRAKWILEVSR